MRTARFAFICLSLTFISLLTLTARGDDADNPRYQAWARFGIGSSETLQANISMGAMQITTTLTMTLDEVAPDHVTVETAATMDLPNGQRQTPPRKQTIQAKGDLQNITHDPDEDVDAAGKTFHCKVMEADSPIASPSGQGSGQAKLWVSSDVPGGLVKIEATGMGPGGQSMKVTYLLQSFDAK